jgi:dolichol kinase
MRILRRNIMHILVGLAILGIYVLLGKAITMWILLILLFNGLWMHFVLKSGRNLPFIETILKLVETEDEEENWRGLGAHTLVLGSLLTIFFFGPDVVVPALLVLSISDALSAIVGHYSDSAVILERRTVLGTITFFVSALIILKFFVPTPIALIVAAIAAIVELNPLPDDNVWIPLAVALSLSVFMPFL